MEMKDKLKKLRQEKGMTQAQLAEALFVSRSTVAKWENGLGLPNPESMAALEQLFNINAEDVATTAPEQVIVTKNRRLHFLRFVGWAVIIALIVFWCGLPFAIRDGDYGFTPRMAADAFADYPYIDTGDYRIYYSSFEGDWDDGRHWYSLSIFRPVQKHFWGCTVSNEDYEYEYIVQGRTVVGLLYSIKGRHGYYNLVRNGFGFDDIPEYMCTLETVSIYGVEYEVQHGFFFITPEPVEFFEVGDVFLTVG